MSIRYYIYMTIFVISPALYTHWGHASDQEISLHNADWLGPFVDEQFLPLTDRQNPGFGVLIMQDGEPAFMKGYGLADLENQTPIDRRSRLYIASMSKQFTAGIIAQLILEERLQLSDPIDQFLPDLPETYNHVTIGHLLFHTSGVREYTSMMIIRGDDPRLQNKMNTGDAYRLIRQQRALDFAPGTEYRYSSSGYVLLAKIIEKLENKPFDEVAQRRLFNPLDMNDTLFDSDHGAPVKNRVESYQPSDKQDMSWKRWLKHFDVVGDGGLLITLTDMSRWDRELNSGEIFGSQWRKLMQTTGTLDTGATLSYGFGLWQSSLLGNKIIAHGGGMGGFIADQIRFPQSGLSLYVFANRNDQNAFQGWTLARRLLNRLGLAKAGETGAGAVTLTKPTSTETASFARAENYADWLGGYFSDEINNRFFLRSDKDGQLVLHDGGDVWMSDLEPTSDNHFRAVQSGHILSLHADKNNKHILLQQKSQTVSAQRYDYAPPETIDDLRPLVGTFWSPELESIVSFFVKDQKYFMKYAQNAPEQLFPVPAHTNINWNSKDKVWTGRAMVKFRHNNGKLSNVDIGDARVKSIQFQKINIDLHSN